MSNKGRSNLVTSRQAAQVSCVLKIWTHKHLTFRFFSEGQNKEEILDFPYKLFFDLMSCPNPSSIMDSPPILSTVFVR